MLLRATLPLLMTALLAAGPDGNLDLRTDLGCDPATRIHLVPPGCFDGLLFAAQARSAPPAPRRGVPGATVEVADFLPPGNRRTESFAFYLADLRTRLLRGFQAPPPSHGQIELAEFVGSDPSHPEASNLDRVRSLQDRFNRVPPSGSPVELK
ncbi:hypothetical protein GETHPA_21080 [Geothrix rubra]|uniref:Uncharacterized protein n=1 Tax=Geothrix rubra TaxID=2927977 RepID=A0ABQ5Q856_9BACT|nr:hypothetical protein [Geothrix rubra]GLH70575.1 hypothetical protein GETHPA_21080 [Geothrix rubra]